MKNRFLSVYWMTYTHILNTIVQNISVQPPSSMISTSKAALLWHGLFSSSRSFLFGSHILLPFPEYLFSALLVDLRDSLRNSARHSLLRRLLHMDTYPVGVTHQPGRHMPYEQKIYINDKLQYTCPITGR